MFRADLLQQLGRWGSHHLHDSLQLVNIFTGGPVKDRKRARVIE